MKRFLVISILMYTYSAYAQDNNFFKNTAIGINLPPLIGRTIDLRLEKTFSHKMAYQFGIGYMHENTLSGSLDKDWDGIINLKSSGFFTTLGARYHTRKTKENNTIFFGLKYVFGYFDHSGFQTQTDLMEYATGVFHAAGVEIGGSVKVTPRFWIDLGFQHTILTKEHWGLGKNFVLPGVGAFANTQGIVTVKYKLSKSID